jgi:hypothetical protein
MHRWRILVAAIAATAMLAAGFGIAVDRLAISAPPAPHLRTISDSNLFASYGVKLSGTTQPPYCGLEQAVARSGWLKSGAAGCAISREAAESVAVRGGAGSVVESLLARISSTSSTDVHNRLAWLVVVRGIPFPTLSPIVCAGPPGAPCVRGAQRWRDQVVFLDAYSGQYLPPYSQFTRSPNVGGPAAVTQRG